MREAAERRQQLELEHEEALAVLNAKQQEIEVLQKAQVEAKKEHEGAVQLLEAKVRELEEKCRNQSEQFNLLSKELEKFRQTTGNIDLLNNPLSACETPSSFCKSQCQVMNGLATSIGKGNENPGSRSVISEYIRPLQPSGERPELLSVKPTFLSRSRPSGSRQGFVSEMDNQRDVDNPKIKYSGKVRLCIARYSYNPYEGPNENPEAELPLRSGKYLYVYGDMDEDGFYEGELMDGRRGLVPSNFVALLQDEELLSFHSSDNDQDNNLLNSDRNPPAINPESESILQDCKAANLLPGQNECPVYNNGTGTLDLNIDEIGEDIVPYPRKITLIKQLAKSVIVGWEPPVMPPGWGIISSYNVLVNKEVRNNIPFGSRTKALIEKLNLVNVTYRISVQSVTDRGSSDELRCSLLVGENVCVAASYLKMDKITQMSAELSWLPSNSNYSHVIFLNEDEYDIVKAASYKYHFFNLKPNTTYKIKAVAEPHQVPWQLPLEQREKKEAVIEFCTLPAGPPEPPQDVAVQAGSIPGTIQVSWKPPVLSSTGTSNGATVTGYNVCTKGQRVAEVMLATAEGVTLDILRIQSLQTREVTVRTLSAEGESEDSSVAAIPPDLLVPPIPRPRAAPRNKPLASARAPDTKEDPTVPTLRRAEAWKQTHPPSPVHGHTLDPTLLNIHGLPGTRRENGRSPSPQRILPQPQGAPIPNTVAKAIAREAAQRVAETNRAEKRSIFSERSIALQRDNSDEEEEVYDMANVKRPGMSVDEFLKGSELGRQQQYSHIDGYHTESSRGSDLSDIMEEDEEELYSEMQLEEGVRRRHSASSHSALKVRDIAHIYPSDKSFVEAPKGHLEISSQNHHCKKLFNIPELAEETGDQRPALTVEEVTYTACRTKVDTQSNLEPAEHYSTRCRPSIDENRQQSFPIPSKRHDRESSLFAKAARSMDDCLWENRVSRLSRQATRSPDSGLDCASEEESSDGFSNKGASVRSVPRKRSLQRQVSVEEELCTAEPVDVKVTSVSDAASREMPERRILGNPSATGRTSDRVDSSGRRLSHGSIGSRGRPMTVPSIDRYCAREHLSPELYEESEPDAGSEDLPPRIFVALFDYDPLSMSPNPDAAEEELAFKEGEIIKVHGDKDADGFYHGETSARFGLIPCNMVSEIQTEDEEMLEQFLRQGFLPLNTPVEKIERNRRSSRQHSIATRRMVALYDYDPRESSPNVDVEAELTFCAGDIITVWGELDEDGFYYGEINGQKGLVPSNFLEEVPDDVEVYLSEAPSRYSHDTPMRAKGKRILFPRWISVCASLHTDPPRLHTDCGLPFSLHNQTSVRSVANITKHLCDCLNWRR
uniref:RIMS-binding protein 2 n=1 Tax=Callorhinchus milii TaxID=7868 RepID=A0A4W3J625_CALMI